MFERPSLAYLRTRLSVDVASGVVTWIDPSKHHRNLTGNPAGYAFGDKGKKYWYVKVDGKPIKRSWLVFLFDTGQWPKEQLDHRNGNSLDDRRENLREATQMQNAWNHKGRRKSSALPMGVRLLPTGRYQARIACEKSFHSLGTFETVKEAAAVYQQKRKEMFGDYA